MWDDAVMIPAVGRSTYFPYLDYTGCHRILYNCKRWKTVL